MPHFIGLIHKDPNSEYGVSFPDFPGCITAASTLDEARLMAEEVLAFHVNGLVEDGVAIPDPTTLEGVMSDPDNRDGVAIMVDLRRQPTRTVRVNVTLPQDVLQQIDWFAGQQGLTRSGFLARAAKKAMERQPG